MQRTLISCLALGALGSSVHAQPAPDAPPPTDPSTTPSTEPPTGALPPKDRRGGDFRYEAGPFLVRRELLPAQSRGEAAGELRSAAIHEPRHRHDPAGGQRDHPRRASLVLGRARGDGGDI